MPTDQEMIETATRVVDLNPLGVLTTVDVYGEPRARWMLGVLIHGDLRRVYSVSGGNAAKLRHIAANPAVCWVFNGPGHEDVVTLTGRAVRLPSLREVGVAWEPLMEATRRYAMSAMDDKSNSAFCGVETAVERVELTSPRLGIYAPRLVPLESADAAKPHPKAD